MRKILEQVVSLALQHLLDIKFVEPAELNGRWYVDLVSSEKLAAKNFFAAVSMDNLGRAKLFLNPKEDLEKLVWVIAHEAVHIAQVCKGDMSPSFGETTWKGKSYINLEAEGPNYFSLQHQPWESEALEYEVGVRDYLYQLFPDIKPRS